MSQTESGSTETGDPTETVEEGAERAEDGVEDAEENARAGAADGPSGADGEAEGPEIEEDLIRERLRIDGICGVY